MTRLTMKLSAFLTTALLGLAIATTVSAADGDALELAWTHDTGKPINLAPLVAGDRVVVVPAGGETMVALNTTTGDVAWEYAPDEGMWERSQSNYGYRVFVCLKGGKLAALDARDGAELWKIDLGINCQRPAHFSDDGTMYVPTTFVGPGLPSIPKPGAKLFSIDPDTGDVNWSFTSENYLLQTPVTQNGAVYTGGSYDDPTFEADEGGGARYYALDAETGNAKWSYEDHDGLPKALYATPDHVLFVAYQDFIQALDNETGELQWRRDTGNWTPSMIGDGRTVYFGVANTYVHAWATTNGENRWAFNIPGKAFDYLLIKPVLADGRLYFMSQRGTVYALNPETGEEVMPSYPTGMISRVGLSVANGYAFMGDQNGRIYAYKIVK